MAVSKFEWILNRVAEVEKAADQRPASGSLKDDADDLVEELLAHASRGVDFPKLSVRLQERITLDLSTLRKAADSFNGLTWSGPIVLTPQLTVEPSQEVTSLNKDIDRIEALLATSRRYDGKSVRRTHSSDARASCSNAGRLPLQ